MAQAGELLRAIEAGLASEATIVAELGEVLAGDHVGRATAQEITVYKSLGIAAQDLALSSYALSVAEAQGRGDLIEL